MSSSSSSSSSSSFASSSTGAFVDTHSQTWHNQDEWYGYQPNVAFALIATVAFALLTLLLLVQTVRSRQWFTGMLAVGSAMECIGYLTRYLVTDGASQPVFILSYILILVTPNLFALVNYKTIGNLLRFLPTHPRDATCLRIPIITDATGVFIPGRIATFFFLSDVAAFFIQASAAAFLTSDNQDTINQGLTIIKIGLAWGLAFIALFFFVTCYVYLSPTYDIRAHPDFMAIRRLYVSLFVTISLLLVRSIYRMAEFVQGNNGSIATHEAYFGVFDTGLMFLACCFYAAFPYGQYLNEIRMPEAGVVRGKEGQDSGVQMAGSHVVQVAPAQEMEQQQQQQWAREGQQVVLVKGSDE